MRQKSSVRDIRERFCEEMGMDFSTTRFLLNGERLEDRTELGMMRLEDYDIIEACKECIGGGPLPKKNLLSSEKQILDALNESSYDFESNEEQSEDNIEHVKKLDEDISIQFKHNIKLTKDTKEMIEEKDNDLKTDDLLTVKQRTPNNSNKTSLAKSLGKTSLNQEIKEDKTYDDSWLEALRLKSKSGSFQGKSSLHKQLKFYLGLPQLAKSEENIVKTLLERIEIHSDWEIELDEILPQVEKKERKRKTKESANENMRCLRFKRDSNPNVVKENTGGSEDANNQDDAIYSSNTSHQRKNLFKLFGIVSPFLRQKVATEEEVRRFSLAIHLWSEKIQGGVEFLHQTKLTDRHFKEILIFAGPSSHWKLIPDRSVTQYRNIWSNAVKGKQPFHGDMETGFATQLKVHDPSIQFCPFQHCQLNSELINVDFDKKSYDSPIEVSTSTSRRQLFTPTKTGESNGSVLKSNDTPKPSPTKEELKEQNRLLLKEIASMKTFTNKKTYQNVSQDKELLKFTQPKIVKCNQTDCTKTFVTVFGLEQHLKKYHGDTKYMKPKQECPFCGKETTYVDQHIKTVHKELQRNDTCEVCKQRVKQDMKKHRSLCIFCPFCDYQNNKKDRLLRHIKTYHREKRLQTEPMDLTSPKKPISHGIKEPKECVSHNNQVEPFSSTSKDEIKEQIGKAADSIDETETEPLDLSPHKQNSDRNQTILEEHEEDKEQMGKAVDSIDVSETEPLDLSPPKQYSDRNHTCLEEVIQRIEQDSKDPEVFEPLNKKRLHYPFDGDSEPYTSEFEDDDKDEFTVERRSIKDKLEKQLREIDELKAKGVDGDTEVLDQFENFMKHKTSRNKDRGGYSSEVSTVKMYTSSVRNELLPAFHLLFQPFDSRWILDCTTPKDCTFEGKQRFFVKPEEPIYITSRIIQVALDRSKEKGGQEGGNRGTFINATVQFMNFIEIFFNQHLNLYGREPFENVQMYHKGVRTFISGTGTWKMCNDEKDKAQNENKVRQSYQHPNKDIEVLHKYKKYLNGKERLNNLNKVLKHSDDEEMKPSGREMTKLGQICMGEIAAATGCRPVVLLRLSNGAYVDKEPGFNPYKTTKDDCMVDEENGDDKIYRRVNPNLPPKNKACKHQLEENVAECPVMCEDRCEPDGYNLFITWDKTFGWKGPSYLHIPKELKHMMDIYDIKRIRYFKGRKSHFTDKEDWIHDDATPFFLNSACSPFKFLNLKHVSEAMGIDVTAYDFRKVVSTWAQNHSSEEIRIAEQEALQHSLKVAKDDYLQNKQSKPQKLTQQYVVEENLFPEAFRNEIKQTKIKVKKAIQSTEEKRTKKRIETLASKKEAYKNLKSENRPLGPRHKILVAQRKKFVRLLHDGEDIEIDTCFRDLRPLQWRQLAVRAVCTAKDEPGRELRNLWKEMYQGDLIWGVRDARLRAKEKNWPKVKNLGISRRDRNSWIAASIWQSYIYGITKKSKEKGKQKS